MGKTNRKMKSFRNFYEEDEWGSLKSNKAVKESKKTVRKKQNKIMHDIQRGAYEDFDALEDLDDLYDD